MKRVGQRDFEIAEFLRAAFAHWVRLLDTFASEPARRFENRENFCVVLFRQFNAVGEVVAVRVRDKNRVESRECFQLIGARRIVHHKGVDEADLAAALRVVPLGTAVLSGSMVALLVLGYLAIYLLIFLPRGVVG